jgi:hypothetical protein
MIGMVSCNRTSSLNTLPMNISSSRDHIRVEGSWRKIGGTGDATPVPNVFRIDCNTREMSCIENGAWIDPGYGNWLERWPFLRLLPSAEYQVIRWEDGILLAEHAYSNSDCTLRISIRDKKISRTWRGTRARGTDLDADKWMEEVLQ